MKYTTNELIGWRLDQAVAKACGYGYDTSKSSMVVFEIATNISTLEEGCTIFRDGGFLHYSPSTNWVHGGPIIEREDIELWKWKGDNGNYWCAHVQGWSADTDAKESIGDTPLVAVMRAFVSAKMGAEVDL